MGISVLAAEFAELKVLVTEAQAAGSYNSPAMNELVKRYEPLVIGVVRSMGRPESMFDDLVNQGRWGVVQAVLHHDGRVEGFTSYLKWYVSGEARQAVKRERPREVPTEHEEIPPIESTTGIPDAAHTDRISFDVLSEEQNLLVLARYQDDRALADIASETDCSVSAVSQRLSTIHRKLAEVYTTAA